MESKIIPIPDAIPTDSAEFRIALNDRLRQISTDPADDTLELLVGTHLERLQQHPAKGEAIGQEYYETDATRLARYVVVQAPGGAHQWKLEYSRGSGSLSARPTDLTTSDAGFEFIATDTAEKYKWNGSTWAPARELGCAVVCTHAQRVSTAPGNLFGASNYADGTQLVETDRGFVYYCQGGAWIYLSGTMETNASALNAIAVSMSDPLTVHDTGAKFHTSDYDHVSMWNGASMVWGPGNETPGKLVFFAVNPGAGWHACDGSTGIPYQNPNGSTSTVSLPDRATAFYLCAAISYTAATQPIVLTAVTGNDAATPQMVQSGSGATVPAEPHTHALTAATQLDPKHVFAMPYFRQ